MFKTLNLLLYQTLNEAFLAWFDEKDDIVQAQKERKKAARNLDVKKKIILIFHRMIIMMKMKHIFPIYQREKVIVHIVVLTLIPVSVLRHTNIILILN